MKELFLRTFIKYAGIGAGLSLGFVASALLAVTISGTINTFASGDQLDATKINENFASLKTAVEGVPNHDSVRVRNSSDISIPNNTDVTLTFDTEDVDSGNNHSITTQTSRLTANSNGIYFICMETSYTQDINGIRSLKLLLNGATIIGRTVIPASSVGNATDFNVCTLYKLAVNDYIEVLARQNSGSTLTISALSNYSPVFFMYKISN